MKLNKIVFVLSAVAALLSACNQDVMGPLYEGGKGEDDGCFAFAASVLNLETGKEDNNTVFVPVYRGTQNNNVVNLKFEIEAEVEQDTIIDNEPQTITVKKWLEKDPAGIFSLATQRVIFQDEAYMAYAQVKYTNIDDLSLTEKSKFRLTLLNNVSSANKKQTTVSLSRRLTYDYIGKCTYIDSCLFAYDYKADVYRAQEAEVYRIMDPYSEGLLAEEWAAAGMAGAPAAYVQIMVKEDGSLKYEPIRTGMMMPDPTGTGAMHMTYAYHPADYGGNSDFSMYEDKQRKVSDKRLELMPVYCLPTFHFGHLTSGEYDGVYPLTIILP